MTLTDPTVRPRAIRLVEYLEALRGLRELPIRDVAEYGDHRWWAGDIPAHSTYVRRQGTTLSAHSRPHPGKLVHAALRQANRWFGNLAETAACGWRGGRVWRQHNQAELAKYRDEERGGARWAAPRL